jgi:molybdopterin converting factor small subunit
MALKQKKDGSWLIENAKDLDEVCEAIEEREQALQEIEQMMEEEYDYLTTKEEIAALNVELTRFMNANHVKHVFRDNYKVTLVKRVKTSWDAEKLKAKLPKPIWLKVTKQVLDTEKLDDLVKGGVIKRSEIKDAFVQTDEKPHVRRYPFSEGQTKEDAMKEEQALRQAMRGSQPQKTKGRK